jgi:hypothetical protein
MEVNQKRQKERKMKYNIFIIFIFVALITR